MSKDSQYGESHNFSTQHNRQCFAAKGRSELAKEDIDENSSVKKKNIWTKILSSIIVSKRGNEKVEEVV